VGEILKSRLRGKIFCLRQKGMFDIHFDNTQRAESVSSAEQCRSEKSCRAEKEEEESDQQIQARVSFSVHLVSSYSYFCPVEAVIAPGTIVCIH